MAAVLQALEHRAARLLLGLPAPVQVRLAGGGPIRVDGQELLPEMQLLVAARRRRASAPLSAIGPQAARRRMRAETPVGAGPPVPVGAVAELAVRGPAGPLRARHYAPAEAGGPRPLLVYLHGGGYVTGDLDTHDQPCRVLCRQAGVHVVSVAYRLAPEHPFPAAVEDAVAALEWGHEHAVELGADPARVAIGGDSAGGNLSAVASLLAAREGRRPPAAQLLLYPATDMVTERPSLELFREGFLLERAEREWYHDQYVPPEQRRDPRASPLFAPDLGGLAPALVMTAAFDPLRDEGEAYADALRAAGNRVVKRRAPGLVHGFANLTGISPAARDALVEAAGGLRAMLA